MGAAQNRLGLCHPKRSRKIAIFLARNISDALQILGAAELLMLAGHQIKIKNSALRSAYEAIANRLFQADPDRPTPAHLALTENSIRQASI